MSIDNTPSILRRVLSMPHTHKVVTTFADGRTREFTTRNEASARMYAVGERRKIGRDLIDRTTGATVRVMSVGVMSVV